LTVPARRAAPTEVPTHLRRERAWAGVVAGDPVDVLDADRGTTWRFAAHVTNIETGSSWVEVTGGRPGEDRRRSCRVELLFPFRSVRRGRPTTSSLADAPRLPLG
jgi:hypothetical protein